MTFYGIRNKKTKKPLGISIFSNDGGEFCNDCGARFETNFYDQVYLTPKLSDALIALTENPDWFNADLLHPEWPAGFDADEWESFSVEI